jgi:hypothetical protein
MSYKGTTLTTNQFLMKEDYLLSGDGRHQNDYTAWRGALHSRH